MGLHSGTIIVVQDAFYFSIYKSALQFKPEGGGN
jgi:hypothetical protein